MEKKRIYKYDNVKALLIFLVVIGHMTTDYVSDSHMVRWITLWIYTFHMPAFIFISGLVHKHYITEERAEAGIRGETRLRWDKVAGFFLCAYGLKIFLQFTRTMMGQNPLWHWIEEPGIPWYLFVMAEYELVFYVMRYIDGGKVSEAPSKDAAAGIGFNSGTTRTEAEQKAGDNSSSASIITAAEKQIGKRPLILILGAFALSAVIGYFPAVGDAFCLSRMINFLPIYMIGYYLDMKKFLAWIEGDRRRHFRMCLAGGGIIAASMAVCCFAPWGIYSWRKWFTGRRSYEFLQDFFSFALRDGWWVRLAVWAVALAITFAVITLMPDRNLGFITTIGSRTLSVYFWHRPLCYLFRTWKVLPRLAVLFGGTYNEAMAGQAKGLAFGGSTWSMLAAFIVYCLIGAAMTALFSLKVFEHPTSDLMKLGAKIAGL